MFFNVFSLVFRSDGVFLKTKKPLVCTLSLGGQNVPISKVLVRFMKVRVSRRGVFNEVHSTFRWKFMCIGGAQEIKTMEILMRK